METITGQHRIQFCNMDGQSIAKQWLGKQTSTIERLFSMGVRAPTIAMQLFGKHVSTVEVVISVGSVQRS
jgi:hypothetical protein